jgi:hypothetical protein
VLPPDAPCSDACLLELTVQPCSWKRLPPAIRHAVKCDAAYSLHLNSPPPCSICATTCVFILVFRSSSVDRAREPKGSGEKQKDAPEEQPRWFVTWVLHR